MRTSYVCVFCSILFYSFLFFRAARGGGRRRASRPEPRALSLVVNVLYIYAHKARVFESRDPDDGEIAAPRRIVDDVARGVAKFTLHRGERVDAAASAGVGFLGRRRR